MNGFVVIFFVIGFGEELFDVCCERGGRDFEGVDSRVGGEEFLVGAWEYFFEDFGEFGVVGEVLVSFEFWRVSFWNFISVWGFRWFCGVSGFVFRVDRVIKFVLFSFF